MPPTRTPWPIDLRIVISYGDLPSQASGLAAAVADDPETHGAVSWRRAPAGSRWADDGALLLRCWVLTTDATHAEVVGAAVMERAIGQQVFSDPPALHVPVLGDVELVGVGHAADA